MKKDIVALFYAFCVWLVCINLILFLSPFIPLRIGYLYPSSIWANFDGVHYLAIAASGYTNNMRFMPLFPLIIHLVGSWTHYFWAAYILTQIIFFIALVFLYKLFRLDYSRNKSLLITVFTLLLPTSFFYSAIYTEGLFLLLTVFTFFCARKEKWLLAAIFGFLASLTRIIGFVIMIPIMIEYFSHHKIKKLHHFIALLFIPLGTALYATYNFLRWGNPFLFIQAHSQLSNGRSDFVFFPQTIFRYIKILLTVSSSLWEWKIALLEFATFCLVSIGIYLLWKQKVRLSYLIYVILSLFVPISSGTFSGLPRYVIVLFPFLILLSGMHNRVLSKICVLCSLILQLLLLLFFSRGYYVA